MTITAKVIADSISEGGDRITTYELEYPRFIHAEFMTHRLFSRNAASSRAIPVARAIELIKLDTAMPSHWGKNQPGMSAKEECTAKVRGFMSREEAWLLARDQAIGIAEAFADAGYHKQIVNRLLEPFAHIKVVLTTTEDDNFFWLRRHKDAQPEIHSLADTMWTAKTASSPYKLLPGDWHTPYYLDGHWKQARVNGDPIGVTDGGNLVDDYGGTLEDALAISSSCCAQVSYRRLDDSLEKARDIFQKLVATQPVHASPFEHQATPMSDDMHLGARGVTHESGADLWSGNFRWWIQHRQLIDSNACWKYEE
jgi:Thymidylate synthase complementing protein